MKSPIRIFLVLILSLTSRVTLFAETPSTLSTSPPAVVTPATTPSAAVASPAPPGGTVPVATAPEPSPSGTVAVATAAAPPTWAQELIVAAEKLPVVGPLIAKALVYLGILTSILTVLVGAILTVLNTLMGSFNATGLAEAAAAIAKFKDGPIMYWLKFFSLFNAKKPPTQI